MCFKTSKHTNNDSIKKILAHLWRRRIMRKSKILIAEFEHETNCFCPDKTGRRQFEECHLINARDVISFFQGTRTNLGGFITALEGKEYEIIPVIAASATPGGVVTRDMFEFTKKEIIKSIKTSGIVDGILLDLHGAMVSENIPDGEGALLKAIREVVGTKVPVISTLDLHANVTNTMIENATAFFPYENYPHTDCFERGYEAGNCMAKIIRKEISPIMQFKQIPILAHTIETSEAPHIELFKKVTKWEENPEVINVAVLHGFPWSDIPDAQMSVIAITDDNIELANTIIEDMAKTIWEIRAKFKKKFISPEEAVKEAMESTTGPVIIADAADNPGGGGSGDSTFILSALMRVKANNVGIAIIPDREAVQAAINAGVGSKITLNLGGKLGTKETSGGPVQVTARVKTIADGEFTNKGPMRKGILNKIGRTVVLDVNGIEIIVPENRMQPFDAEIFRRVGIEPSDKKIIVLKSVVHFKASFGPMAKKILAVNTPAYASMDFESLNFKHIQRPIYPLDNNFEYTAS
jgi:microcystin degradation protein MlrC